MIDSWPDVVLGGFIGAVIALVGAGAVAGTRQRADAPAGSTTVAPDFLAHLIAEGRCEWVARHLADTRRLRDGYGIYPHPVGGSPCQRIGPGGVMEVLMIRPGATGDHLPGPNDTTVFQELMSHARTGSTLRFSMLTVFLTATAALLAGFASQSYPRGLIAAGGLALSVAFLVLEMVLSLNLAALNETARKLARARHGDIMTHRRPGVLWAVRITLVLLFLSIIGFWAVALFDPARVSPPPPPAGAQPLTR
ncbi:MAG: hypothetical protein DWQ11_04920 [Proteobacteria bacterium]|nr:MAG: hypothetical protein DWQ11_04920 [Pseudomonadota bacterium]